MDRAPACGADGCAFESRRGHFCFNSPISRRKLASTPRALIRIAPRTFFLLIPHFTQKISEYPKGTCSHPTEIKFQPPSKHINLGRFCLNLVNAPHPFHQLLHGRASGPSSSVIHQRVSRSNSTTIQPDLHHTPTAINIQPQPLTVSRETFTDLTHL